MKFGEIELTDWTPREVSVRQDPDLIRYIQHNEYMGVVLYTNLHNMIGNIMFFNQLQCLQDTWWKVVSDTDLNWDIEFAKQTMDAFLIKMNNLRVFL